MKTFLLAILVLAGCGTAVTTLTPEEALLPDLGPAPPSVGGMPGDPVSLRGTVRVGIDLPPIRVREWSWCRPLIRRVPPTESRVVDADGNLRWAFVVVKKGLEGRSFDGTPGEQPILLRNHRFWPHVVGARAGQALRITNTEDHLYDVHALPFDNKEFNFGLPTRGDVVKSFAVPERMVLLKDDVHPWMKVWVGVVDHPFFAVTGADGAFEFRGLPPGRYTIEVWSERFVSAEREIEVKQGEEMRLDVSLDRLKE